jgi:hypothetical protein
MGETRATAKLLRLLWIASMSLVVHSMNAETSATGGIEGDVTVSPIHGGPSRLGVPDMGPMPNTSFLVENAAGGTIVTFKTDEKGHFKVELPPGRYAIKIEVPQMKGHGCGLADIEVTAGTFKTVKLDCDTGMR